MQVSQCFDFLLVLLDTLILKKDKGLGKPDVQLKEPYIVPGFKEPPQRRADVNFTQYSYVLQHPHRCYTNAPCQYHRPSDCPKGSDWSQTHLDPSNQPGTESVAKPADGTGQGSQLSQGEQEQPSKRETAEHLEAEQGGKGGADTVWQKNSGPAVAEQQPSSEDDDAYQQDVQKGSLPGAAGTGDDASGELVNSREQQEEDKAQAGMRRLLSQAMSVATGICLVGVIAVVVLWRMNAKKTTAASGTRSRVLDSSV